MQSCRNIMDRLSRLLIGNGHAFRGDNCQNNLPPSEKRSTLKGRGANSYLLE